MTGTNILHSDTKRKINANLSDNNRFTTPPPCPLVTYANNVSNGENIEFKEHSRINLQRLRFTAGDTIGGRTKKCGCKILAYRNGQKIDNPSVSIVRTENGAHFSGLETCGSIWNCPVCALKITQFRAKEVEEVVNNFMLGGGNAYMMTLTMKHDKFQTCAELKQAISGTLRKVRASRAYSELCKKYNHIGEIRGLEVTYGVNGWHPHLHLILLLNSEDVDVQRFAWSFYGIWKRILKKQGYGECSNDVFRNGLKKVFDGAGASDYITKSDSEKATWNAASEITKGHIKSSKGKTPFALLQDVADNINAEQSKLLFREYSKAFKGARQLTWTKGLRKNLSSKDDTDQDIVEMGAGGVMECYIDKSVWHGIIYKRIPGHCINAYLRGNMYGLLEFLGSRGLKCDYDDTHKMVYLV